MFLVIGGVLGAAEVAAAREAARSAAFEDGRATAGRYAREVKNNEQAMGGAAAGVLAKVEQALGANEVFAAAARPRRLARLMLSRYREGQSYGAHVDDAIMAGARTDLSFTLFLSAPESYEGGALIVSDALEERRIRLNAGDMILYPSSTLHRVEPVTSGERLAVVGWAQSWVRDPAQRETLFDLETSLREVFGRDGKSDLFDRLAKTRSNLLRMWADG